MGGTPGLRVWLAALLPLLPVVLALAVLPVPHVGSITGGEARVQKLDGSSWRVIDSADSADAGNVADAASPALDDSAWHAFTVPGTYGLGHNVSHGWARRHFTLEPRDVESGGDLYLMVPNIGGFARVFVNGHLIGAKGVPESGYSLDLERLDGFTVPRTIVDVGDNVLALELVNYNPNDGVPDPRFLLGPPSIVQTYLERAATMKWFLEYGAMMVTLFGIALISYLYQRGEDKALYRSSLLVMVVVVLYLCGKTGLVVGYVVDAGKVGSYTTYTIIGIALATPELIESYYVGRVTWFRKFNRVLCALWFVAALVVGVHTAYKPLSPWLFIVIVHALVFVARDLRRPKTEYGPVLASAIAVTAATGAADLLCDMNLVYLPRLFSYGVANLGVIAIVLAFADFLRLQKKLAERNSALVDALARAEETSRLKSEFLANTSHELRTPLNAIINLPQGLLAQITEKNVVVCAACGAMFEPEEEGAPLDDETACPSCGKAELHMESRKFPPDDADALAAHLRSIIGSGEHLLAVVNDILDYSKLAAGKMKLTVEPVVVADVVERAFGTVRPGARTNGVTLSSTIEPGLIAEADGTRLVQILINLVNNAVKFSPANSVVDVTAKREGEWVRIDVVDRGIGIAKENHAAIFESFRQIEGGHTRKRGGTGLGLAIVKQMVDMHHGTIDVDSDLGRGATFTLKLPRSSLSITSSAPPATTPATGTARVVVNQAGES